MTWPTRSGIPTTYRGTNFRSRLEARWAAFFDLVGWSWTYEPLDADGYIPDFLIHGPDPLFLEVGPCITDQDYIGKSAKAHERARLLAHDVLVVGVSPLASLSLDVIRPAYGYDGDLIAGLLGELGEDLSGEVGYGWGAGVWSPCHDAAGKPRLAVFHATNSFGHRPCADSRYGGYPSTFGPDEAPWIERLWAEAGNAVQWKKAA